ncbi:MAG: hypothetical protein ACI88H_000783, partial [Cocleimonas sp.]
KTIAILVLGQNRSDKSRMSDRFKSESAIG